MSFLRNEPAFSAAVLSVIGAVLGIFIKNPELVAALVGVAAVFIGVRQVVTPVTTMTEKVTEAATEAATEVTKSLGRDTVGAIGTVTDAAQGIIDNTVGKVIDKIL